MRSRELWNNHGIFLLCNVLFTLAQTLAGMTYPGTGDLDPLLDFDQLTFARGLGNAFGGFSEARVKFYPTYKFDKVITKGVGRRSRALAPCYTMCTSMRTS